MIRTRTPYHGAPSERVLRVFVILCVVSALYLSALVYPWRINTAAISRLESQPPTASWLAWLYHDQLRSQLQFTNSTLVYKEAVAQALLLTGLAAYFLLLMLRALHDPGTQRFPAITDLTISRNPFQWIRRWLVDPTAWAIVLLVYLALTVVGVHIGKWVLLPGSPTFHYSLRTWFAFALGVFTVLCIPGLRLSRHATVKIMAGLTLCGVVVAFVALLEHLNLAGFFLPPQQDPQNARNRLSSLIGHNTGMSSWLMFPLSFALYFCFISRRRWVRWFCWCATTLFLFVILAAQSRAIWLLAATIAVFAVWSNVGILHLRVRGKHLLIGAALVLGLIGSQTIGPSWNPLARTPMPFFARLKHDVLNLDQLRRETRLRIAVVSIKELIAKKPITGTGFGSFQWVYPPAQGHYLTENLETLLGYTTKRTDLAHNDYIQLLVEAGFIGLVLVAIPVGMLLGRGWIAYRAAILPQDRALLLAVALPLAAVAAHALVDFPLHVVPIALEAAVCMGLLAAAPDWILSSAHESTDAAAAGISESDDKSMPRGIRWKAVAALAAVGTALFWVPLAMRNLVYREFASDIYASDGQNWLATFDRLAASNFQMRKNCLDRALADFRKAIVLNVFNGTAYEGQSRAFANRGTLFMAQSRVFNSGTTESRGLVDAARGDLEASIRSVTNQLQNGELRYHYTFYMVANSYRGLWNLNPDPTDIRQRNYIESAKRAYERAIETNIADVNSLVSLSEMLDAPPFNDAENAAKYRRVLFKIDPDAGYRLLLEPSIRAAENGDTAPALQRLDHLQQSVPEVRLVTYARALVYFYKSVWPPPELDKEDASSTVALAWRRETLRSGEPACDQVVAAPGMQYQAQRLRMLYAAARGEMEQARASAQQILQVSPWDWESMAVRDIATEAVENHPVPWRDDLKYYAERALFTIYLGADKRDAAMKLGSLAFQTKLNVQQATRLLAFMQHNGWTELIARVAPQLLKYYPGEPALQKYAPASLSGAGT